MNPFTYVRAADADRAVAAGRDAGATYLAGGTTLVDLMRLGVMAPSTVVDVGPLPLAAIEPDGGGLRIGAMARNSDVANHPLVASRWPALSEALLAGASPQVRNMATVGGNLLQRTRCPYFRDASSPCNKREPGSGCPAWEGYNRSNAVLGGSDRCIATHPSDMCVALVALDAVVHVRGPRGERAIPAADFHVLPAARPDVETVLEHGELVTHVTLPAAPFAARSAYLKVRDRASFAFALASAAVALDVAGGAVRAARVALGGVATKPWRSREAEAVLVGHAPSAALFKKAADAALREAVPRRHNAFKVELAKRTLVRALGRVGGAA
jgi:xanthine dehydrogenase YagS FAD-binding subunit